MAKDMHNSSGVPDEETWMYEEELPEGYEPARALLRDYSHIPAEDVDSHIRKIVRGYGGNWENKS